MLQEDPLLRQEDSSRAYNIAFFFIIMTR